MSHKTSKYIPSRKSLTLKKHSSKPLDYMNEILRLKIMAPSVLSTLHNYFNNPGSILEEKFLTVCQWLASSFCEITNLFTRYLKTVHT